MLCARRYLPRSYPSSIRTSSYRPPRTFAHTSPEATSTLIQLRDYQEECIQAVLSHLDQGHKRLGISLATGSGKTVIFTHLIDRLRPQTKSASQTLILAHRRELVEQAARHCLDVYPSKQVDLEMGRLHASGLADITVASVRSISSKDRIQKFDPKRFKLILVDEAHHIVAPGYMDVLEHFGLHEPTAAAPALVGVSATMSRFDGVKLGAAIDHIVYHKDYVDMIQDEWLSKVIFTTVRSTANVSRVKDGANGDFQPGELSRAINTDQVNLVTVRAWMSRASSRRSTLVFCADLAHVMGLTNMFRRHGVDARFITGQTGNVERHQNLEAFKTQEFPVLVNCGVFTEGIDIPNVDCVLLARPTKSRNLLVQMIGRGMRLHPGKENCHILDMVASLETGIITTPTLFGLDPSEIVDQTGVKEMKGRSELYKQQQPSSSSPLPATEAGLDHRPQATNMPPHGNVTFTDYDSVEDLIRDTSTDQHVRALSPHAWVQVGPDRYVLSTLLGDFLTISKSEDMLFHLRLTSRLPNEKVRPNRSPFMRPRELATAPTLVDALHGADTFAAERFPSSLIAKNQRWRKAPASEGQLLFLNRLQVAEEALTIDQVTKGKAADMITKIKHGARGWFDQMGMDRRREDRQVQKSIKAEARRRREEVHVGPLPD